MLRTNREGRAWLVTQPHHAEVAGYLAAHWGNREFVRLQGQRMSCSPACADPPGMKPG